MRRSLFEFYTLLICLSSLIGFVVAVLWFFHGLLSWSDPELMVSSYEHAIHQTNERYWQERERRYSYYRIEGGKEPTRPSDEEITRMRHVSIEAIQAGERREGKKVTLMAGFGVIISGVLFIIHWRLARQARQVGQEGAVQPKTAT